MKQQRIRLLKVILVLGLLFASTAACNCIMGSDDPICDKQGFIEKHPELATPSATPALSPVPTR